MRLNLLLINGVNLKRELVYERVVVNEACEKNERKSHGASPVGERLMIVWSGPRRAPALDPQGVPFCCVKHGCTVRFICLSLADRRT